MSGHNDPRRKLPESPELSHVFLAYPAGAQALLAYHDAILRGDAPLTVAERELIAAFVSGLNACDYCYGAHSIIAGTFGIDESLLGAVVTDPDGPATPERLRPILKLVEKLTRQPASVRREDREAVLAAGWTEEALFYAVSTCALFNFMNRVVEGMGVVTSPAVQARQRARHARDAGGEPSRTTYRDYGRAIGLPDTD